MIKINLSSEIRPIRIIILALVVSTAPSGDRVIVGQGAGFIDQVLGNEYCSAAPSIVNYRNRMQARKFLSHKAGAKFLSLSYLAAER